MVTREEIVIWAAKYRTSIPALSRRAPKKLAAGTTGWLDKQKSYSGGQYNKSQLLQAPAVRSRVAPPGRDRVSKIRPVLHRSHTGHPGPAGPWWELMELLDTVQAP